MADLVRLRAKSGVVVTVSERQVDRLKSRGYRPVDDKPAAGPVAEDASADYVQVQPKRRGRPRKTED